jgi:hypothetical protein
MPWYGVSTSGFGVDAATIDSLVAGPPNVHVAAGTLDGSEVGELVGDVEGHVVGHVVGEAVGDVVASGVTFWALWQPTVNMVEARASAIQPNDETFTL